MVVVDRSTSMQGEKLASVKSALPGLFDYFDAERDQIGLVTFADRGQLVQPLANDYAETERLIKEIKADGSTNLTDGLKKAVNELQSSRHNPDAQPVVVLLADGESKFPGVEAVAQDARDAGITIITIGLGNDADMGILETIAGAEEHVYKAVNADELTVVYREIGSKLDCAEPSS
jgi:Mg-chelatase subunit ChlD